MCENKFFDENTLTFHIMPRNDKNLYNYKIYFHDF